MFESPGAPAAVEPSPSVAEPTPSPTPESQPPVESAPSAPAAPDSPGSPAAAPASSGPAIPPDTSASEWAQAHQGLQQMRAQSQGAMQQVAGQYQALQAALMDARQVLAPDQYAAYEAQVQARQAALSQSYAEHQRALEQVGLYEQQLGTAAREWQLRQQFEPLARTELQRREETRALQAGQVPADQKGPFLDGLRAFLDGDWHDARDMPATVDRYVGWWRKQQQTQRATDQTDFMGGTGGGARTDYSRMDPTQLWEMEAAQFRRRR